METATDTVAASSPKVVPIATGLSTIHISLLLAMEGAVKRINATL
jgi:hypothetical protein